MVKNLQERDISFFFSALFAAPTFLSFHAEREEASSKNGCQNQTVKADFEVWQHSSQWRKYELKEQ